MAGLRRRLGDRLPWRTVDDVPGMGRLETTVASLAVAVREERLLLAATEQDLDRVTDAVVELAARAVEEGKGHA